MNELHQVFSLVFLAVASFLTINFWIELLSGKKEPKLLEIILWPVFPIAGAVWVAFAFTSTITLFDDAIELRTLLKTTRLPFTGIRGRREYVIQTDDGTMTYLKLEPNDDRLPVLDFQDAYNFDSTFYDWFHKLPDLDKLGKTKPKNSNFGLV
ncbi:MAG TPA: hypothetical protein VHZ52_09970 [Acidobacteriaceae bacterium]|nr:hypothetical protein [Acidobacteriaceae bacterium]